MIHIDPLVIGFTQRRFKYENFSNEAVAKLALSIAKEFNLKLLVDNGSISFVDTMNQLMACVHTAQHNSHHNWCHLYEIKTRLNCPF